MQVKREFQPITIVIQTKEEADIFEAALELLIQKVQKHGGSWWAGWKDQKLTPQQMYYRAEINRIRFALNPSLKERSMFMTEYA